MQYIIKSRGPILALSCLFLFAGCFSKSQKPASPNEKKEENILANLHSSFYTGLNTTADSNLSSITLELGKDAEEQLNKIIEEAAKDTELLEEIKSNSSKKIDDTEHFKTNLKDLALRTIQKARETPIEVCKELNFSKDTSSGTSLEKLQREVIREIFPNALKAYEYDRDYNAGKDKIIGDLPEAKSIFHNAEKELKGLTPKLVEAVREQELAQESLLTLLKEESFVIDLKALSCKKMLISLLKTRQKEGQSIESLIEETLGAADYTVLPQDFKNFLKNHKQKSSELLAEKYYKEGEKGMRQEISTHQAQITQEIPGAKLILQTSLSKLNSSPLAEELTELFKQLMGNTPYLTGFNDLEIKTMAILSAQETFLGLLRDKKYECIQEDETKEKKGSADVQKFSASILIITRSLFNDTATKLKKLQTGNRQASDK